MVVMCGTDTGLLGFELRIEEHDWTGGAASARPSASPSPPVVVHGPDPFAAVLLGT
jgi:hypothetical protein